MAMAAPPGDPIWRAGDTCPGIGAHSSLSLLLPADLPLVSPLGWSHLSGEDGSRLVSAPHRTPSPSLDPRLTISLFVPSPPYLTARHRGLGSSCSLLLPILLCAVSPGSWEIGSVVVGGQTIIIKGWQEKLPCCLSPSLPSPLSCLAITP